MGLTEKGIYQLLPAYYRSRDFEQGSPLEALISIIASKAIDLENNIGQLYDNWFIETCEEWIIPYIGDLLGVQNFTPITGSSAISQRAYIANTLAYRRRKGIAPVLEQLANDIAGWRAHVVEFFQLLVTTQYMNHIRLDHPATPDLRLMNKLDLLDSPFDSITHSVDVRSVSNGRGKYNIQNIGLFIWRIQSYKVVLGSAAKVLCSLSPPPLNSFYFTFNPLGYDSQLFNNPETEAAITHISEEINLPVLLRRLVLYDELDARRQAIVDGAPVSSTFFSGDPVFEIFANDDTIPIPPEKVFICSLEACCTPPASITYAQLQTDGSYKPVDMPISVAVDPVTGRFVFTDPSVTKARVSYSYGFSADIGSGTYNRQGFVPDIFVFTANDQNDSQNTIWQVGVSKTQKTIGQETIVPTITEALSEWKNATQTRGIICIMDNETYEETLDIQINEKKQLLIIAADWPVINDDSFPGEELRINGIISANDRQPLIIGDVTINSLVKNPSDFETQTGGQLTLNGLLIQGKIKISKGNVGAFNISNCTLDPKSSGIEIGFDTNDVASNQWLQIVLQKSICGAINLYNTEIASLIIEDSIVDNQSDTAISAAKIPLQISRTTVLGKTSSKTITAENCIFDDLVEVERKQTGCIRFSYVPLPDFETPPETPQRFRCQPELEVNTQIANAKIKNGGSLSSTDNDDITKNVLEFLVPAFTSTKYGHYAYGQLNTSCPVQITTGADDGGEMGAFHLLMQPQRKANILTALDEYLRVGLAAGLFYVT